MGTEGKGGQSVMLTIHLSPVSKINKASVTPSVPRVPDSEMRCYGMLVCWYAGMLRRLAAGLSPRKPRTNPRPVHVGFVVDIVELLQVFLRDLRFSSVSIIPPVLDTDSFIFD